MAKKLWINLPVADVKKSTRFFTDLGFTFNSGPGNTEQSAAMLVGDDKTVVMLFEEAMFSSFFPKGTNMSNRAAEVLLSLDASSVEEVDSLVSKAIAAGGASSHNPQSMKGWMYGAVFTDLDGHHWNVLYMDVTKLA